MKETFLVRRATPDDATIIAWHRARMFQDMGQVGEEAFETLRARAEARLSEWLVTENYLGWLASPSDHPKEIISGAGVLLQPIIPRPLSKTEIGQGQQGTIVNVFTEPAWRRRGIAGLLLREIIAWSKDQNLDRLLLHASLEGRSLYEKLGFIASNEMRFTGE